MATDKKSIGLARTLYRLSFDDGTLSAERVEGALAYLEKHPPRRPMAVLKHYYRLAAAEIARGRAVVEHAGPVSDAILASIADAMTGRYHRPVSATARPNPELIAGLRVTVGCDVYEASIVGQLSRLAP